MNIFEQLEKIDKIIEKKFELEAQNMMQILEGSSMGGGLGFGSSGLRPLMSSSEFQMWKSMGGNTDRDNDGIPDNMDYYYGPGQYDPNDLNHNGIPDYLEE